MSGWRRSSLLSNDANCVDAFVQIVEQRGGRIKLCEFPGFAIDRPGDPNNPAPVLSDFETVYLVEHAPALWGYIASRPPYVK